MRRCFAVVGRTSLRTFVGTIEGAACYNPDGSLRWQAPETIALAHPHDGPVLDGTTLYTAGPGGESIVALAVETGNERWRRPLSGEPRSPVSASGSVYVQDATGELEALARSDGSVEWATRLSLRSMTGVTVADGSLLVGADKQLPQYD